MRRVTNNSRKRPARYRRKGAAVVEMAVCLPVLLAIGVATIDACSMFHVQQALKITAYEGARVGIVPQAKAENVLYQCETLLDDHGVKGYSISMEPADPTVLVNGDYFTVTVSADFNQNALVGGVFTDKTLIRSVTLRAE